jgi:hypothetical protein
MPQSLPRRIETLESKDSEYRKPWTIERLIREVERLAKLEEGLPANLHAALRDYIHERLGIQNEFPPGHYLPDLSELLRRNRWRKWDHPALMQSVDALLRAIVSAGRTIGIPPVS